MEVDRFTYHLPEEFIAQTPASPRDSSRLMVVDDGIQHLVFRDIVDLLDSGDLVIINDTRVVPARLEGTKDSGGRLEFLLHRRTGDAWTALIKGRPRIGATGSIEDIRFEIVGKEGDEWTVRTEPAIDMSSLESLGNVPLPPYIHTDDGAGGYQTVYAERPGSIAAPTAGLHFTDGILGKLREKGVEIGVITLHIGPGTFTPVRSEMVEDHVMQAEEYEINEGVLDAVSGCDRLVCVGTSSVRALETALSTGKRQGSADVFIYPGYEFSAPIDMFLTNFHLPRSAPILMTAAIAGWDRLRTAYETAVNERYRFYSFGDAMMIFR